MMPTLVIIAPLWNSELEELIYITKSSFQLKILTQKQNFDFEDPYVEILQCFDTYSPLEMTKLVPWLFQLSTAQFHLILPHSPSPRQLAGIGTIISITKALPQSYLTHSPWPLKSWTFSLWLKAFQSLFDGSLLNYGTRRLSLPKTVKAKDNSMSYFSHETPTDTSRENQTRDSSYLREAVDTMEEFNTRELNLYSCLWIFPTQNLLETEWQSFIYALLRKKENRIELWNWEELSIRQKNKMRQQFYLAWNQFQPHPPRWDFDDWTPVQFLVLTESQAMAMSEKDLLDLILIYKINIIMDDPLRRQLKGPWQEGDTFWLWEPSLINNEQRPWNNSQLRLPFTTLPDLVAFRDQLSNEVLRSLNR